MARSGQGMCLSPLVPGRRAVWLVCAHVDGLLLACGHAHNYLAPSNLGAWNHTRFPRPSIQADISPARRKRGERSSGGNRIHLGSRHYHEDGNHTDDVGRRWNLKRTSLPDSFAYYAEGRSSPRPHHIIDPRATAASLRSNAILRRVKGRFEMVWASQSVEDARRVTHESSHTEAGEWSRG